MYRPKAIFMILYTLDAFQFSHKQINSINILFIKASRVSDTAIHIQIVYFGNVHGIVLTQMINLPYKAHRERFQLKILILIVPTLYITH